jgi:hypothetical protein
MKLHFREREKGGDGEQHIFISYSWAQQEEVVKVKDRLKVNHFASSSLQLLHFMLLLCLKQEHGFRVWIDVDQMCGSTLEAMASGIENASVVLICASENYKISPNCRTGDD